MGFAEVHPRLMDTTSRFLPTRTSTWALVLMALLAAFGLHHMNRDIPSVDLSKDEFPVVPSGKPGTVSFKPCGRLDCGYVIVPKDYFDSSVGTATVAFARSRAPSGRPKGTIFLNPGGPGASGVYFVRAAVTYLHQIIGQDWDLVGFDPRGIGQTLPVVKCFPNQMAQLLYENTVLHQGWTVPNTTHIADPINKLALTTQARQFIAINSAQTLVCHEHMDIEDLKYMGTTTVVRDIDFMSRIFGGPDAKIHFYGGSYGSLLGAYLVNMFPQRIGRAVIDGIVDPVSWSNESPYLWHKRWTSSTEATYQWFLNNCAKAGPDICSLAKTKNEDPVLIENRLENFMQDLVSHPLAATANGRPGYITSGAARGILFRALCFPSMYKTAAHAFAQAMLPSRDGAPLLSLLQRYSGRRDLNRLAVVCADAPSNFHAPTAEDIADEFLRALANTSAHFGAAIDFVENDGGCEFWPTRGRVPERFVGPFNASLEYPLLIISNTADPDTPIADGLLVNRLMGNSSTLLIQNGPGHGSLGFASLCTIKAQLAYWAGQPPKNGTVCEVPSSTFPGSDADTVSLSEMLKISEDDALLRAAHSVSSVLEEIRVLGLNKVV